MPARQNGSSGTALSAAVFLGAADFLAPVAFLVAFLAAPADFLAPAAFLVAFLATPAFFAPAFLAPAFLRVEGPAARRSASSSEARSMVIDSTTSPLRSDAFVVPSVT